LDGLDKDDARVNFIYDSLNIINSLLIKHNSALRIFKSSVADAWVTILNDYEVQDVYVNEDYVDTNYKSIYLSRKHLFYWLISIFQYT
jgi:deoxyribodipyrimidine photo-lyase